jgi:multidrug efflux pump subunit AcrA (membrane-fusion protein)
MDAGIVSYLVRITVASTDLTLRSGLTANASIITQVREDVVLVPNLAIAIDSETGHKYVDRKTLTGIEPVEIETGLTTDQFSEVVSGLKEGDSVVVSSASYREQFREMMGSAFTGGGR